MHTNNATKQMEGGNEGLKKGRGRKRQSGQRTRKEEREELNLVWNNTKGVKQKIMSGQMKTFLLVRQT